jgi:AcrR family transcriptional regulator
MLDSPLLSSKTVRVGFEKEANLKKMTEARREGILAVAKTVFEEVGFENATMSEISTRMGGSKATLYRYFESKEVLFQELLRRSANEHSGALFGLLDRCCAPSLKATATQALAVLDQGEDVAATLQEFGEQLLETFHTPQRLIAWRMVIAAAADPAVGRMFYENGPARGLEHVQRYFERTMQAGQLRSADARVAAAQFRALVEAEVAELGLFNVRPTLGDEEMRTVVVRAVDVFMRAYGPESTARRSVTTTA